MAASAVPAAITRGVFSPLVFATRKRVARNSIQVAAMTNKQSNPDSTISQDEIDWLSRRSKGGFGVVVTCASHVSADGQGWHGEMGCYDDKHIEGLTKLRQSMHAAAPEPKQESLALVQIFHGGGRADPTLTGKPAWGPSALEKRGVRGGTEEDIERLISDFAKAAQRAEKAGFDGVELHGAHGYILSQFLAAATNKRSDKYGGILENRARVIRSVFAAVRKAVSSKFIVGVRISPERFDGLDFDDQLQVADWLVKDGVDFLHVSCWDSFKLPEKYPDEKKGKTIIERYRELMDSRPAASRVPLIVAGKLWSLEDAQKAIALGADSIALGLSAIGNPDWPLEAAKPGFSVVRPPHPPAFLREQTVSAGFVHYLRAWPNFVAADEPQAHEKSSL